MYNNVYGKNQRFNRRTDITQLVFIRSSNIIRLFDGGRIMYGFANPSPDTVQVVRGNLTVELLPVQVDEVLGRPFNIHQVDIWLNKTTLLYSGEEVPKPGEITMDTLTLNDGIHQLHVKISGDIKVPLEKTTSFIVDNYWETEDELEAPSESSWFGMIDYRRTSDRSMVGVMPLGTKMPSAMMVVV